MFSKEKQVRNPSDYYIYTPSTVARELYFYPTHIGHFFYDPDYRIERDSYESFLLMYIKKGEVKGHIHNQPFSASKDQLVLLDCYTPHAYGSDEAFEALWLHFDGPLARAYYEHLTGMVGFVFSPPIPALLSGQILEILTLFRNGKTISEGSISSTITSILEQLKLSSPVLIGTTPQTKSVAKAISFINQGFKRPITLEELAKTASLSPFYFTRLFLKETGYTPHQYLIATRISAAKYMLKATNSSIKEIAFQCGFQSESNFCAVFKKWVEQTPGSYR